MSEPEQRHKQQILQLLDEAEDELIKLIFKVKEDRSLTGYDYFHDIASLIREAKALHDEWYFGAH